MEMNKMRKIDWGQFANYLPAIVAPTVLVTVITATAISVSNIENRGKNAPRAVKPISYKIEKHDVDQVFRDHNVETIIHCGDLTDPENIYYFEDFGESHIPEKNLNNESS